MLFDYDLTIPAGTAAENPVTGAVKLTRGTLKEIRVLFPPGPATLVHVVVRDQLHQLVPANPEGDLNFDDVTMSSVMEYALTDAPFELQVYGWSPLATYEHMITFQFVLEPVQGDTWQAFTQQLFSLQGPTRRT